MFIYSQLQLEQLSSVLNSQVIHSPSVALITSHCDQCPLNVSFLRARNTFNLSLSLAVITVLMMVINCIWWWLERTYFGVVIMGTWKYIFKGMVISISIFCPVSRQEGELLSKWHLWQLCLLCDSHFWMVSLFQWCVSCYIWTLNLEGRIPSLLLVHTII